MLVKFRLCCYINSMTKLDNLIATGLDARLVKLHSNNKERRKYLNQILDKELLEELFQKHTAHGASIEVFKPMGLNLSAGSIIERARKLGIITPSIKDQVSSARVRDKYKQTCLKKYGAENALSRGSVSYHKRNKTVLDRYGVNNVFELEAVKKEAKRTMMVRYGAPHNIYRADYHRNFGRKSKPHIAVENMLDAIGVSYKSEKVMPWVKYNKELGKEYCPRPDIVLTTLGVVVEVLGDRWHANPAMYKPDDMIPCWEGKFTAEEIWKFDAIRVRHIESFGFSVHSFWERDIKKTPEQVKEKINEICKNTENRENT